MRNIGLFAERDDGSGAACLLVEPPAFGYGSFYSGLFMRFLFEYLATALPELEMV